MSIKGSRTLSFVLICYVCTLFHSCAGQYNINGDSTVSTLDGRMLYLKALSGTERVCNLDSCEVIHGKFNFMGIIDSICMGELCMDNQSVMPVVIEDADLSIRINPMEQRVTGGTLNNRLYRFLEQKNILESQINELSDNEARLILNGHNPIKVHEQLSNEADKLFQKMEKLETEFIIDNYNNILGSTFFMMLCSQYPYPVVTKQIKQIIHKASPSFRDIPFVKEYMNAAEANMRFMEPSPQPYQQGKAIPASNR